MKFTKKCENTFKSRKDAVNKRHTCAGFSTLLQAGASVSLILMPLFSLFGISNNTHATTSTISVSIADSIGVNVLPSSSGTFAKSDDSISNVSIKTTNGTGYTLGIRAGTSGSNNALINKSDSTKTIPSITSSISESTFSSSTSYNNMWGFKPSKYNSVDNTTTNNYYPAPTSSSTLTTLDKTTSSNPTTNNNYNITIGTRITSTQATGSYENTFVLTVTANPAIYSITYNKNTTDTVSNMPTNISNQQTSSETVNIASTIPTRDGFDFKGWCTTQIADSGTCSGTTYNPDGGGTSLSWTLDQTLSSNSLNLYAMWKKAIPTMQDATFADCGKTMTDSRDGKSYTTAKLADGKCWMTTNLNLAGGTTLSSNDTDMDASWTLPTANGFQSGNKLPASSTSGFSSDTTAYVYNSAKEGTDCSSPGCYGYFSWTAATLGSGLSITADNTDAPYSICPKGWHLPNTRTGTDSSSDFRALMIALGGSSSVEDYTSSTSPTGATMLSKLTASPNNFLLAGKYYDGSFSSGGGGGGYWSATSSNSTNARYLNFNSSDVYSAKYYGRRRGGSVRCVKDLLPMQSVTNSELASMLPNTGDTVSLEDERDGKDYLISKLADGKYWMVQNLNLAGGTTLSSNDTDMDASWTLPTANGFQSGNKLPASSTSGFSNSAMAYVYNSAKEGTDCSSPGCYGYYSWTAATLGSGLSITTDNTDAPYSICPKGWHLPNTRTGTDSSSDFRALMIALGGKSSVESYDSSTSPTGATMSSTLQASPNNLLLAGNYNNSDAFVSGGSNGSYWSATSADSTNARRFDISSSSVNSDSRNRRIGRSVRCVFGS